MADAIIKLLNIDLSLYKTKEQSLFSKVRKALNSEFKSLPITEYAFSLFSNNDFNAIIGFRHRWVHNQRVQIESDPRPHLRNESWWINLGDSMIYPIGSEEIKSYDYNIETYSNIIRTAYNTYYDFFKNSILFFINYLSQKLNIEYLVEEITTSENEKQYKIKISKQF